MALPLAMELQQLYVAYFTRPADVSGLTFWTKQIESGQADLATVSASFAASAEYQSGFFNLSPAAVVSQIYHNLFGRAPEPLGLAFWSEHLAAGRLTIDRIVRNIADGAQGSDQEVFSRKVAAATAFTDALRTPDEITGYGGALANQLAADFISAITHQQSLDNALLPAPLQALVTSVVQPSPAAQLLTRGQDTLAGGAAIDTFHALAGAAGDTLQSGDVVNGGSGNRDRLNADISAGQALAVAPELASIEHVVLHGLSSSAATGMAAHRVVVDATRSTGVTHWESSNSARDVLIEGVGSISGSTADITVAMVGTDAGNVDFGVYFKQALLGQVVQQNEVLRLQLLDARNAGAGKAPLLETPYDGVAFFYKGILVKLQSKAIDAAQTYDELVAAFQVTVAATPGLGGITVSKGPLFTITSTFEPWKTLTGTEILLTASDGSELSAVGVGAGWLSSGAVPDTGGSIHTSMSTLAFTAPAPRTSSIILDDVGRGGTGGDLVVGGAIAGVERFAIELRDSSKLQTINSTNNTLSEVTIKNGMTTSHNSTNVQNRGDLTVLGTSDAVVAGSASEALPGTTAQHNGFGFSDVRVIDASLMSGKINFSAEITAAAIPKYILMGANNASSPLREFVYTGGANNDTINLTIDGSVLAADTLQARVSAHGGGGNDTINITTAPGKSDQPYYEQVHVSGGAGNDVVLLSGAGRGAVDLGEGDDSFTGVGVGDSTVTGGLGNDRIVLGNTLGATEMLSSNDMISFDAGFGNDTIVNFSAGGMGRDMLNFTRIGGVGTQFSGASVSSKSGSIAVQASNANNDTLAEIAALHTDFIDGSATHVFITYDTANVGKVYTVMDAAGSAPNLVVTLVGTIDLGDTAWSGLTADNFGTTQA